MKTERVGVLGPFVRGPIRGTVGAQLQYQIVVTNTGSIPLSVLMTDSRCDPGTLSPVGMQQLQIGSSATYTCTHLLLITSGATYRNVASATGYLPGGSSIGPLKSTVMTYVIPAKLPLKRLTPALPAKPVPSPANFTG